MLFMSESEKPTYVVERRVILIGESAPNSQYVLRQKDSPAFVAEADSIEALAVESIGRGSGKVRIFIWKAIEFMDG